LYFKTGPHEVENYKRGKTKKKRGSKDRAGLARVK